MRYVIARYHEIQRDKMYRIYVTDSLQAITNILAQKAVIDKRFYEIAYDDTPEKPKKTSAEVKAEILDTFRKLEVRKE